MTAAIDDAEVAARAERRWATISVAIIIVLFAGWRRSPASTRRPCRRPASRRSTRHAAPRGEFVETNLGSALEPDGAVTVRAIGQQYSFTPQCILVPAQTPIKFRATSADVDPRHPDPRRPTSTPCWSRATSPSLARAFEKPGDHLMPCQEFCSFGHEGMWAKVKVIDKAEFLRRSAKNGGRLSCVD